VESACLAPVVVEEDTFVLDGAKVKAAPLPAAAARRKKERAETFIFFQIVCRLEQFSVPNTYELENKESKRQARGY